MFTWPFPNKAVPTPQTELSSDERTAYYKELYGKQFKELRTYAHDFLLGPVELTGGFDGIMNPQKWELEPTREECWLAQEDFWVRRELLYVVGMNMVLPRSYMYPVEIDEKDKAKLAAHKFCYRYRNQNWEITLLIKQNKEGALVISGDSTIKNVNAGHQTQPLAGMKGTGLIFDVTQPGLKERVAFEVKGEPVSWDNVQKFSEKDYPPLVGIAWDNFKEKPVFVSQSFDWLSCPIKRIEAIEIGQQSCRTFTTGLKANDTLAKLDAPPEDPNAKAEAEKNAENTGSMTGNPAGGMMGSDMMMKQKMGGMNRDGIGGIRGGGLDATNSTPNNHIPRNRYLQAPKEGDAEEKPSRHLPLAMKLLVDQAHVQDVLTALANSRLRIQITQVHFQHVRGSKPLTEDEKSGGGSSVILRTGPAMSGAWGSGTMMPKIPSGFGSMPPSAFKGKNPGSGPPPGTFGSGSAGMRDRMKTMMPGQFGSGAGMPKIFSPSGGGGFPPVPGESGSGSKPTPQSNVDDNLIELTVYGIATLYRKPPDPAKTDGQPEALGTPEQKPASK
jgi:hypothetical protein